jgi:hypothetical protein
MHTNLFSIQKLIFLDFGDGGKLPALVKGGLDEGSDQSGT